MIKSKKVVALVMVLVCAGIWLLGYFVSNQKEPQAQKYNIEQPEQQLEQAEEIPLAHREVVAGFIRAYYSMTYQDAEPNAWVGRATAWTTKDLASELTSSFGNRGGPQWSEFVLQERYYEVQDIELQVVPDLPQDIPAYVVDFSWLTQTAQGKKVGSKEMRRMVSLIKEDGRWRVAATEDLLQGPSYPDQIAPTDSPEEEHFDTE